MLALPAPDSDRQAPVFRAWDPSGCHGEGMAWSRGLRDPLTIRAARLLALLRALDEGRKRARIDIRV